MPLPRPWGTVSLLLAVVAATTAVSAPSAASASTPSSPQITVAVVDSGVDLDHPALRDRLWRNHGEHAGNGRDDDGNGFVDDVHGADLVAGDGTPDDARGHGTMMAGIVAGHGRSLKPATAQARIMALRVVRRDGTASLATVGRAIDYAVLNGADVVNISLGSADARPAALTDALARAQAAGVPVVVAAGNAPVDLDRHPAYPASYTGLDNLIVVAACQADGRLASFSAYGEDTVDVCAPGVRLPTALRGGRYGTGTGTSHATARVSGALAKLLVHDRDATAGELVSALTRGARRRTTLLDAVAGGAALDLGGALRRLSRGR